MNYIGDVYIAIGIAVFLFSTIIVGFVLSEEDRNDKTGLRLLLRDIGYITEPFLIGAIVGVFWLPIVLVSLFIRYFGRKEEMEF